MCQMLNKKNVILYTEMFMMRRENINFWNQKVSDLDHKILEKTRSIVGKFSTSMFRKNPILTHSFSVFYDMSDWHCYKSTT